MLLLPSLIFILLAIAPTVIHVLVASYLEYKTKLYSLERDFVVMKITMWITSLAFACSVFYILVR